MYRFTARRTSFPARSRRAPARVRDPLAEKLECRTLLSAGDPDPTFGGDGFVFGQDVVISRGAEAVAVQTDGKVVVVGSRGPADDFSVSRARDLLISRFNADGTRDTAFGTNGSIVADLGGYDVGYAVQIDDAGRIVVGATAHNNAYAPEWVVLRYLPTGAPDTSFGTAGRTRVNAGSTGGAGLNDLDLEPGGKIVAAGRTADGAAVMRFTASGQPDTTFDGDGKAIVPGGFHSVEGVEVAGDNRIVVAGRASFPNGFAARLNENGSPDTTFSGDGRLTTSLESPDVAADSAGRVVLAGMYNQDAALRRFTPSGQVDESFGGGDGLATFDAPGDRTTLFASVAVAPGDKPVASGTFFAEYPASENFLTARFNADGSPDTSFNATGYAVEDFYVAEDRGEGVALAPGGKVVTAGFATVNGFTSEAVVRYNADGTRDATFDSDGKVVGTFEGARREINDVIVQPDRKVVVGGAQIVGPRVDFFLARFNPDGSPDTTFEGNGRLTTYFGAGRQTMVRSLLLQPDGKIVAVGSVGGADVDIAIARYHPDGSLDFSFGGDGTVVNEFGQTQSFVVDAAMYPGGKIVVAGSPGLIRYNPDGSVDTSLGGNGVVEGVWGQLLVQGEKILVDRDVSVARYNADGSPDPTFASPELEPGVETGDENDEEAYSTVEDMAFMPDGDVIVLGAVHDHVDEREKYALWRLNPDGTLDTAFGRGGRVIYVPDDPYHIEPGEVAVQGDGRIVVNGSGESSGDPDYAWVSVAVRHDPDGSLDTSFGIDGVALFGRRHQFIGDPMDIDPTGDIVVAGRALEADGNGPGWGVARLDSAGTAGGVTYDRDSRRVTVKGELGDDNIHINLTRGRLFVNLNGRSYNFTRTSVGSVRVYGRDGNDTVTVTTEVPDLQISGGAGNDTLRGGPGRERLIGNDGDDLLDGGPGADTMIGGAGTDSVDYRSRTNSVRVVGSDASGGGNGEEGENDFVAWDIEKLYGGSGDDVLNVLSFSGGAAFGGGGNDTLRGRDGADALWGDAGDDLLYNSWGADYLRGGSGNDTVFAAEDPAGDQDLVVTLDGKANDGRAGEGDNVFTDVEHVVGGGGDDHITGSSANNRLEGSNGNDTLLGGAGNDTLVGGTGADTLTDTQGTNTLDGGFGTDTVNGVTEPSDAVTLQAESATRSGGARVASTSPGYTGTGYVEFTGAGYIEFTFNAPSAGRYRLTVRYANGTDDFGSMPVAVNDTQAWHWGYAPTGSWSTWSTQWVDITLSAGDNRVRLSAFGADAAHLDSLVIS